MSGKNDEMLEMRRSGATYREIADRFGVTKDSARHACEKAESEERRSALPDVSRKRVFVMGPMNGVKGFNREAFDKCERVLKALGAKFVYNPSKHAPMSDSAVLPHAAFMRELFHELSGTRTEGRGATRKSNFYDVMELLPGWEADKDAVQLSNAAKSMGIEVELWTMPM